jgi:endonuclease/exonuclease/phosphatase family metal-dependent hydrolase
MRAMLTPKVVAALALAVATAAIAAGESAPGPQTLPAPEPGSLRVVTWNLHQGYTAGKQHVNPEQIAFVAALAPDVVAFQELAEWDNDMPGMYQDGLNRKTNHRWQLTYEADVPDAPKNLRQGTGLATWRPASAVAITHIGDRDAPGNQVRQRTAVRLQVEAEGVPVVVATTHLDHKDTDNRRRQLDQLREWMATAGPRQVVVGDFNDDPEDAATFGAWRTSYEDAWLAPVNPARGQPGYTIAERSQTHRPGRVDYQWYRGVEPVRVVQLPGTLSDHDVLVVDWRVARR